MNDKQEIIYKKLRGKYATIRFDTTGHGIKTGTLIFIHKYIDEIDSFMIGYDIGGRNVTANVKLVDINLREEKYNLKSILLKGHRIERPDKYDYCAIELLPDEKSIYLSTHLRSLLLLNQGDFIGFSFDTDTRRIMIFKAKDEKEGWELGGNGRIKSSADWRELMNEYGDLISVMPELFTDDDNYPGYLFYNLESPKKPSTARLGKSGRIEKVSIDEDSLVQAVRKMSGQVQQSEERIFRTTSGSTNAIFDQA